MNREMRRQDRALPRDDAVCFHDKQRGLEGLLAKYSTEFMAKGRTYIEKLAPEVRVFRIRIEAITGKAMI